MTVIELLVVGAGVLVVSWLFFRMNRITPQDHTSYLGQMSNVPLSTTATVAKPKIPAKKVATKKSTKAAK